VNDVDDLWPAIARADADAFARFLTVAELPLRRSLASFARTVDVEAVVQEALLRVWQVAPRFVPDGRPHGLLRLAVRIARNLAVDETRRTRRTRSLEAAHVPTPESEWLPTPDPLLRDVLARCFGELPRRPGEAMRARLESAGAEPDAELATGCRMSLNTFLQNVTRARRLLTDCVRRRAGLELGA